ncbi:MAG TPA: hypothetical protein VE986_00245 [Hyphomicrobiales bacterium]|nr:hypothetical protein [Hyphomicrobiales bacterium]
MRLNDLRNAIVASLKANIPELRDVQRHGGRFDEEELRRFSLRAPAARVALMGVSRMDLEDIGKLAGPVQMIIYLIVKTRSGEDDDGLDLAEKIADFCEFNQWGMTEIEAAHVTALQNLYNSQTDREGIHLWAIAFDQAIAFGTNRQEEPPTGDEGLGLDGLSNWPAAIEDENGNVIWSAGQ